MRSLFAFAVGWAFLIAPVFSAEIIEIDLGAGKTPTVVVKATTQPTVVTPVAVTPAVATPNTEKPTDSQPDPEVVSPKPIAPKPVAPKKIVAKISSSSIRQIKIEESANGADILLVGKSIPEPTFQQVEKPLRWIWVFKNTRVSDGKKPGIGLVKAVRFAPHAPNAWVVAEVDPARAKKHSIEKTAEGMVIRIAGDRTADSSPKGEIPLEMNNAKTAVSEKPGTTDRNALARLIDISVKDMEKGVKVVLTTDGPVKYQVRKLVQPDRLLVHLQNTRLDVTKKFWNPKDRKAGLLNLESRHLGQRLSPISEVFFLLEPGATHQIERDSNQIVVTLQSGSKAEKPAGRVGNLNQLVSIDLEDADMKIVLKSLGTEAGFDMDVMDEVAGTVNQKLKDVPLKTVLAVLLSPGRYNYEIQGNLLRIGAEERLRATKRILPHVVEILSAGNMRPMDLDTLVRSVLRPTVDVTTTLDSTRNALILNGTPADIAEYKRAIQDLKLDSNESDQVTKVVKLNYSVPSAMSGILTPYLTPQGRIQTDERTQRLIIWDVANNMGVLLQLIKELDVRQPQVLVESNIVEMSTEKGMSFGVDWSIAKATTAYDVSGAVTLKTTAADVGRLNFGTIKGGFDIHAAIKALETQQNAKVISRPRIATSSGVMASISTVEEIVYLEQQETIGVGGTVTITQIVQRLQLPITLQVTPRITDDGRITTQIVANIRSVSGPSPGAGAPPPTTTQTATTTLTIRNGETIVIGGLVRDIMSNSVKRVPILGSLPVIGALFQSREQNNRKVELVIFITPTLLLD